MQKDKLMFFNQNKIELANIELPRFDNKYSVINNRINYGEDNLYPQFLADLSKKSVTHSNMLNLKVDMVKGEGFSSKSGNAELETFIKKINNKDRTNTLLNKIAHDITLYDGFALNVIYSMDRSMVADIQYVDFKEVRISGLDDNYKPCEYAINKDWANLAQYETVYLPTFEPEIRENNPSQLYYFAKKNSINDIYSVPAYVSALNYITLEYELSKFHLSNLVNSALPSTVFIIPDDPNPNAKEEYYQKFTEMYRGTENAGNFMLLFQDPNAEQGAQVQQLQSGVNDALFETYVQESKSKILSAHNATSPVLAGISGTGNLSGNANELIMAHDLFQNRVIDPMQAEIENVLNGILDFNFGGDSDLIIKNKEFILKQKNDNNND